MQPGKNLAAAITITNSIPILKIFVLPIRLNRPARNSHIGSVMIVASTSGVVYHWAQGEANSDRDSALDNGPDRVGECYNPRTA